jgi:acetolactate synthase-1/2/3 large subunit
MNGAEALVRTLVAGGIEVCFANPGTSEMHLVAALDRVHGLRCVLGLFEGVVTGAADGYGRMAGRPAATLMHLGPGLANGAANLHNARKAGTGIVNIVGEHATAHRGIDAPLSSDIAALARPVSHWVHTCRSAADLGADAASAIAEARVGTGRVATLIVPADAAWSEGGAVANVPERPPTGGIDAQAIERAADDLKHGGSPVLIVGGPVLVEPALSIAARIAGKVGARLLGPTGAARAERGASRPRVERIPYLVDRALEMLAGVSHAVLCGVAEPVAFFAYPGRPSRVLPTGAHVRSIAPPGGDVRPALLALEDALCAHDQRVTPQARGFSEPAHGALTLHSLGISLCALLPDNAILVDESITSSFVLHPLLLGAAPHDFLQLTGGSIGIGLPLATGAAIAAPDRKVVCLEADGSGMYTLQALWTQAREQTSVVTVLLANRAYAALRLELASVGIHEPGPNALSMLDIGRPDLDWVRLAQGMGVGAARVRTADAFNEIFAEAIKQQGPFLIEVVLDAS